MMDALSAQQLMQHVRALADDIGPRPAGQRGDFQARLYVRRMLQEAAIPHEVEEITFPTPDSLGYAVLAALGLTLAGNLMGRRLRGLGGALALLGAYSAYQSISGRRQPLNFITPGALSGNLIVRFPPSDKPRHIAVVVAHLDTNKHRFAFTHPYKRALRSALTTGISLMALNGLAQWFGWRRLRSLSALLLTAAVPLVLADESDEFVPGANDNASAVACLLGLAAHLHTHPLQHTEVWLAFTGAEQPGCLGMQALLDKHREVLADAWFIDLEMVGAGDIAYVTHHTGLSHFSAYTPDAESLAWAAETARANPQFGVRGKPMRTQDELGTLRSRGFRGISLVSVSPDGWPAHWNQRDDRSDCIEPRSLEQAARFAWAMLQKLDERR